MEFCQGRASYAKRNGFQSRTEIEILDSKDTLKSGKLESPKREQQPERFDEMVRRSAETNDARTMNEADGAQWNTNCERFWR
jgi:hypothetical protein